LFPIIVVGLSAIAVCLYANAKYARYNAETHYSLGNALAEKGQYDAAIAEYREAIRLKPHYAEAHNNLGMALKRSGKSAQPAPAKRGMHKNRPVSPNPSAL